MPAALVKSLLRSMTLPVGDITALTPTVETWNVARPVSIALQPGHRELLSALRGHAKCRVVGLDRQELGAVSGRLSRNPVVRHLEANDGSHVYCASKRRDRNLHPRRLLARQNVARHAIHVLGEDPRD